jgi:hypothetical protein
MSRYPDWLTVICALGFVAGNLFSLAIWIYGVIRTGLSFFYLMIFVACFGTFLSVVNTAIYYNPPLFVHLLGQRIYGFVFYTYIYCLLLNFILSLIGFMLMTHWIYVSKSRQRDVVGSNQSMQPTAGRPEANF